MPKTIPCRYLEIYNQVGSGGFGCVYRGKWLRQKSGNIPVALKFTKENVLDERQVAEEAENMSRFRDRNIVKFYGICLQYEPACVVMEHMENGSLLSYVRRNHVELRRDEDHLIQLCSDVCNGLAYLEANNYVHRDVAARNCLVNAEGVAKVSDFGLTRSISGNYYCPSYDYPKPFRWMAPEVISSKWYSIKADVWSYGVLVWEVFTLGQMPYGSNVTNDYVERYLMSGQRLRQPKLCCDDIYTVLMRCWELSALNRPTFDELSFRFDCLLKDYC